MSDSDQAPLALSNLISRGYTMAEAKKILNMVPQPVASEAAPEADVDEEAAPLPFATKKPGPATKKPTSGLL